MPQRSALSYSCGFVYCWNMVMLQHGIYKMSDIIA